MLVIINIYGYSLLRQRATLLDGAINEEVFESQDFHLRVDGYAILSRSDLEFILSRKSSGEQILIELRGAETAEEKLVTLGLFYSDVPFHLLYLVIGLSSMFIGTFVFVWKREELKARIFYWAMLTFASTTILSGGFYCLRDTKLSFIPCVIFYICYPLVPAFLLHVCLSFWRRFEGSKILFLYIPAFVFIGILEFLFLYSATAVSIEAFRRYLDAVYVFRFYVLAYFLASIYYLIYIYRKTDYAEQRAQIKWILYGLFVGAGPFVIVYQMTRFFQLGPINSEEISMAFFLFIPIAMAIAIVKHKLLDIEVVINRSLVYSILTIFVVGTYLLLVRLLQNLLSSLFYVQDVAISAAAAFGAALIFHPVRRKIQDFVDKTFFRLSYDYRQCILYFNEHAHMMIHKERLVDFFKKQVMEVLPVDYLGILVNIHTSGKRQTLIKRTEGKDLDSLLSHTKEDKILARKKSVFVDERMDFSLEEELNENQIELMLPITSNVHAVEGALFMGRKKSSERYRSDDIELLSTLMEGTVVNLERISLQEEVVYERTEKEKLDDINRAKSEFIASVSHELRTPMSSLRGLTELLQSGKIKEKSKRDELLGVMANECSRLSRFLHNILDMGRIEQEAKTYRFAEVDIKLLIQETLRLFDYRIKKEGFVCKLHFPQESVVVQADRDALSQALTNIIDNAIKYSTRTKEIDIYVLTRTKEVEIRIKDKGMGIPLQEQELIFKDYYRGFDAQKKDPSGVGIGLKIVRHIMSVHRGKIMVESQVDEGTSVSLIFQIHEKDTSD